MKRTWLLVAGAAVVIVAAGLLARGDREPATIEDRAQAIAAALRCPVCQNLSVADSPSRLAGEMRAEVEGQLRAGRTDDEVRAFFVARYGEWVLLEPRSLPPFLVPIAAVLVGLGAWAVVIVRRRPRAERTAVTDAERRRIDGELRSLEEGA
jgi:cytochrome c-type biogenesis protein CcmH